MNTIHQFLISLTCGAVLCAIIKVFFCKNSVFFTPMKLLCGIFLVILFVTPWADIRFTEFQSFLQEYELQAVAAADTGMAYYEESVEAFITERTQAYILDKAADAALTVQADVYLADCDPPYPQKIIITGHASPLQRQSLSKQLCQNLNISEENLIWNGIP